MKAFIFVIVTFALGMSDAILTGPKKDLGTITDRTGIRLIPATNRSDFLCWRVEVECLQGSTNWTTTNMLLTANDFAALPPGRTVLGLRQVCSDGAESRLMIYTLNLVKDNTVGDPDAERFMFMMAATNETLLDVMQKRRSMPMNPPPTPQQNGGFTFSISTNNDPVFIVTQNYAGAKWFGIWDTRNTNSAEPSVFIQSKEVTNAWDFSPTNIIISPVYEGTFQIGTNGEFLRAEVIWNTNPGRNKAIVKTDAEYRLDKSSMWAEVRRARPQWFTNTGPSLPGGHTNGNTWADYTNRIHRAQMEGKRRSE